MLSLKIFSIVLKGGFSAGAYSVFFGIRRFYRGYKIRIVIPEEKRLYFLRI